MKKTLSILILAVVLLFSVCAMAADKVVIIPFGSSGAKGTDGQVQYNDEGKTAGAEVYYNKVTGSLEVSGEVRTVDEASNNRLWGKGRPGTKLLTHTDPNGYCTSPSGVKFALSDHWALWANADDVCPSGTWVCSVDDLSTAGTCPIVPITTTSYQNCNTTWGSTGLQSSLSGWLADAEPRFYLAMYRNSNSTSASNIDLCYRERAWCCWK